MNTSRERGGLTPLTQDHRDFDFIKTKRLAGAVFAYPEEYSTDAKLWTPDQNEGSKLFKPPVPPMPYGCTNYTQCDLLADQDKKLYNPVELENITRANEKLGTDLRTSLKAVVKLYGEHHPAFFNVQPDKHKGGFLDWFDAVRAAMLVGAKEHRAVSVGTQWFQSFNEAKRDGILPAPSGGFMWHNWAVKGWTVINGQTYLIGKPWAGRKFGDKGFCYVSRPLFNQLMSVPGAGAFTLDKLTDDERVQRIDLNKFDWLVSFFTSLISKAWSS
jgi:hypothetical protein